MRKFFIYFLSPLIIISLAVLEVPEWKEWIKCISPRSPEIIAAFTVVAAICNYILTVISPERILNNARKRRWKEMDDHASKLQTVYSQFDLSFNIMTDRRKLLCRLEPSDSDPKKTKITWFPRVFETIWTHGTHHVNTNLRFTVNQGSCGQSYKYEDVKGYDLIARRATAPPAASMADFKLNQKQLDLTAEIKMVASCPIVLKQNFPNAQKITILGILNVECNNSAAVIMVNDNQLRELFYKHLYELAQIFASRS